MDYHRPLWTLYYNLKKLNTLNYMDPAPSDTLLHPSTPYNTLKMFKVTGLSTLEKGYFSPEREGGNLWEQSTTDLYDRIINNNNIIKYQ